MTTNAFTYTPVYAGPQMLGAEPDLLNAVTNLWAVSASATPLATFTASANYLTHGSFYSVTAMPLNFMFLTRTLTEITANLLTLSPGGPPPPPNGSATWQQAVQTAFVHPPVGTSSGPIPLPWGLFDPATGLTEPGQANVGWWTGGIDFYTIKSTSSLATPVTLKAASVIDGNTVTINSGKCLATMPGTSDGSKTHINHQPKCH